MSCLKEKAESVGIDVNNLPRSCNQCFRRCSDSPSDYYKTSITIPFIDHLSTQLNDRFPDDHPQLVLGSSLIPKIMKTQLNWIERVLELGKFYQHDLPSAENLDMELLAWKVKWDSHTTELQAEPQQTLRLG